jgi:hypothetical protein
MKNWPRWQTRKWAIASQSQRICVADSYSSRHLSHMGSTVNPSLKRCPFRWQCPVSSTTIHLSWSLLSFNRSLDLLAEGPTNSSFACLSPVRDSHWLIWFLFIQSLAALLATPNEMPQAETLQMPFWLSSTSRRHTRYIKLYVPLAVLQCYTCEENRSSSFQRPS